MEAFPQSTIWEVERFHAMNSEGVYASTDEVDPKRLAELMAQGKGMPDNPDNLTPEQILRLVELGRSIMGKSQVDRDNMKLVLSAMIKAYEASPDSDDDMIDEELDEDILEAIAEMRQDPEFDPEILDEMERNYRESFIKKSS